MLLTLASIPLIVLLGKWLLLKLFPPKPIVIVPITDEGRVVIEKTFIKAKPLVARIWESDGVLSLRLTLALFGLIYIISWFI